jgi:hypothetical protein
MWCGPWGSADGVMVKGSSASQASAESVGAGQRAERGGRDAQGPFGVVAREPQDADLGAKGIQLVGDVLALRVSAAAKARRLWPRRDPV